MDEFNGSGAQPANNVARTLTVALANRLARSRSICMGVLKSRESAEQLRETTIIVVARWTIAISLDPLRMLREKRVVHCTLKIRVARNC